MNATRTLLLLALVAGCTAPPTPVYQPGLDRARISRVCFRPEGKTLHPTNALSVRNVISAGSPARVTFYSDRELRIELNGLEYVMLPMTGEKFPVAGKAIQTFLAKYFVDEDAGLDIEALGPEDLTEQVKAGTHVIGMTKEQVFTALGPPYRIHGHLPAAGLSREQILLSDHWVYLREWFLAWPSLRHLYFGDGRLQKEAR